MCFRAFSASTQGVLAGMIASLTSVFSSIESAVHSLGGDKMTYWDSFRRKEPRVGARIVRIDYSAERVSSLSASADLKVSQRITTASQLTSVTQNDKKISADSGPPVM